MFVMHTDRENAFESVYNLMQQAFPPTERRNREAQYALLQNPHYSYRILQTESGDFLGFLAVWDFGEFRFAEHFAVNEASRGKGVGANALRKWIEESSTPVVLEVEPPETEMAQRRIGFYKRVGFQLNSFSYIQPSMQPDQPAIPLQIMSWPNEIPEEQFEPWKQTIYREVYGTLCK